MKNSSFIVTDDDKSFSSKFLHFIPHAASGDTSARIRRKVMEHHISGSGSFGSTVSFCRDCSKARCAGYSFMTVGVSAI